MEDFSKIYDKLIDMGFPGNEVDSVIGMGLYSFDDIFNELVKRERSSSSSLLTMDDTQDQTKIGKSNDHNDYLDDCTMTDDEECFKVKQFKGDTTIHKVDHSTMVLVNDQVSEHRSLQSTDDNKDSKMDVLNYPRIKSSFLLSLLSNKVSVDSSKKNTTKIQVMDLLDPSNEPETYSHPFLANVCTIRDLICWFYQSRSAHRSIAHINEPVFSSRVAISADTEMHSLINLFESLKWHFVLPSGASSQRICGRDSLDRLLEDLGLVPHAHLLAIVGCPGQPQEDIFTASSSTSTNNHNGAESSVSIVPKDFCHVEVKMINYRNNPLYLQGRSTFKDKYNVDRTMLQKVVTDFANFSQLDLSSFSFLDLHSGRPFSFPDDHLRSLKDLGFVGNVTLYCHAGMSQSDIQSQLSDNDNDNLTTSSVWHSLDGRYSSNNHNDGLFAGSGYCLEGIKSSKTIRDIWSERSLEKRRLVSPFSDNVQWQQKSLFLQCVAVLYKAVKGYNFIVCREVRRLPNNLQQVLIRKLIEEKSLSASILALFCTHKSRLSTLDLSYTIQATNDVLKSISKCINLQELVLDNEDHVFTNEGLLLLRSCVNLRRLSLNYCSRITDWGIKVVIDLPKLSVLSIKQTGVTDTGLSDMVLGSQDPDSASIFTCPPLTSLDLSGLSITDHSLHHLASFTKLELLSIASTPITDPSSFPQLNILQHLNLSNCMNLIWDRQIHIRSLAKSFPSLTSISLAGVSNINLVFVTKALALCTHLRQIDGLFSHPQMTSSLVSTLSHLPLDTFILSNCSHVDDLWIPVMSSFSSLNHLVLSYCPNVYGKSSVLLNNFRRLSHLSWLDLTHLENVDSEQICRLVLEAHFPSMQVVWFSLTEEEELIFRRGVKHVPFKINITRSVRPHFL